MVASTNPSTTLHQPDFLSFCVIEVFLSLKDFSVANPEVRGICAIF